MACTIGEAAERAGLSAHTLRYYDREGLLPFVEKTPSGTRIFKDADFEWLFLINCLKQTGMPIRDIRQYIDWLQEGDSTLRQRYEMFLERRAEAERQMADLRKVLEKLDYKCSYYEEALAEALKMQAQPQRAVGAEEYVAMESTA